MGAIRFIFFNFYRGSSLMVIKLPWPGDDKFRNGHIIPLSILANVVKAPGGIIETISGVVSI